uniref:RRM domain-containing protein n=1 Tax=Hyaloperonospora arabidopsidis (strain Emoy2) TaxID=559515 RepID=M4BDH3_HYAAE
MAPSAELWLYLDAVTGQQKGPVSTPVLKKLLRKSIVQSQQLVWTQRLSEWAAIASVEPLATYCQVWMGTWYYMAEGTKSDNQEATWTGPVTTQQLVQLFVDGEVDGEVPSLKEFLQEANSDLDREAELQEQAEKMPIEHQVFEKGLSDALVAENGKQYVFDAESKTYVTPEEKIEEELASLQETMMNSSAGKQEGGQPSATDDNKKKDEQSTSPSEEPIVTGEATSVDPTTANVAVDADVAKKRRAKKKKKSDKWKRSKNNTWVYVNGLPLDITVQEVHDHFAKCGVIQADVVTGDPRIKLYQNKESGGLNGDGSVCYMKEASVELAAQLLDKSQIRPEWPIDVAPAAFKQKGENFVKRKKPKIDARAKIKRFEKEKHMFTPAEIEDEAFEKELQDDIHGECSKIGEVSKITLFAKHVDGVVVVKFASSGSAARCIEVMNGRFFAGRKLECGFWDGTDYTHRESENEEDKRAEKFQEWLEEGSSSSGSEVDDDDKRPGQDGQPPHETEVFAGRTLPPLVDDSDDSDVENNNDPGENKDSSHEVYANKATPSLDDGE